MLTARSPGPIKIPERPSTARISSTLATASVVSICANRWVRLLARVNASWRSSIPNPMPRVRVLNPRAPRGGYLPLSTIIFAWAASLTIGTSRMRAPASSALKT